MKQDGGGHPRVSCLRVSMLLAALAVAQLTHPAWSAAPPAPVSAPMDRTQIERQLESVATLLERSSAARQVEMSGAIRALERRDQARESYRLARQAFEAGRLDEAAIQVRDAGRLMLEAVRAAAPAQAQSQAGADKAKTDYNARSLSVKALLAAYQRIGTEKVAAKVVSSKEVAEATRGIEQIIQEATRLAGAENYARANTLLQQAYLTVKAAVSGLRQGDTLVRSLNFASKEEEFHYELDRNDTHQMLVKLMLVEKRAGAGLNPMVRGYLEKAGSLRGLAEASASRGEFEQGVKQMEESTQELVRAIRSAGIFIPG